MTDQTITLTSAAFARIEEMRENKGSSQLRLRIAVEGGGAVLGFNISSHGMTPKPKAIKFLTMP